MFKLAAVIIFVPVFVLPGIAVFVVGRFCGQLYIKAQLSVKREMSNRRSPVLAHFGAAIAGLGDLVFLCSCGSALTSPYSIYSGVWRPKSFQSGEFETHRYIYKARTDVLQLQSVCQDFLRVLYASQCFDGSRWVCIRIDVIGSIFASGLGAYLVYGNGIRTASDAGFSLTMAVGFSGMILWWSELINLYWIPLRLIQTNS